MVLTPDVQCLDTLSSIADSVTGLISLLLVFTKPEILCNQQWHQNVLVLLLLLLQSWIALSLILLSKTFFSPNSCLICLKKLSGLFVNNAQSFMALSNTFIFPMKLVTPLCSFSLSLYWLQQVQHYSSSDWLLSVWLSFAALSPLFYKTRWS